MQKKERLFIFLFFVFTLRLTSSFAQQKGDFPLNALEKDYLQNSLPVNNISPEEIHAVMNEVLKQHADRIPVVPSRSYYNYNTLPSDSFSVEETISFLKRVHYSQDTITELDLTDYRLMLSQIMFPSINKWDKKKLNNVKVDRNHKFLFNTNYSVSVPLFSKDKKTIVFFVNYWGMSRIYLYHLNTSSGKWEGDSLWQDGS